MTNELIFSGDIGKVGNDYICDGKKFSTLENALGYVGYQADLMRARKCRKVNTLVFLNPDGSFDCQWHKSPYQPEEIQHKLDNLEITKPNGAIWTGMVLLFVYIYPYNMQNPFFTKLYMPSTVAETVSMIL